MVDLRSLILNHAVKTEDVATPFWSFEDQNGNEVVNGHIALRDIPTNELLLLKQASLEPAQFVAALLIKSLVNKDSGQLLFQDSDRDAVAARGTTELTPLFEKAQVFFGLGEKVTIEEVKKKSETSQNNISGTEFQNAFIRP